MRICFISHSAKKGGAERSLLELLRALKKRKVEMYVILPTYGDLYDELRNLGITISIIPYCWWMSKNTTIWKRAVRLFFNITMGFWIASKLKCWKPDIVYTNTITICVGAFAAKILGIPHVWHVHEFGYEDHGLLFDLGENLSLQLINKLSAICIANSNATARKYQQYIPPSKLKVIYYAVSLPNDNSSGKIPKDISASIKCAIVGQLQKGKRQEDAILAIRELVRIGLKPHLFIVGDGDPEYQRYLYELVYKNKLNDYITFTGYVDNPIPFMGAVDVVLMCSKMEAFGRVTVEAMKLGKPVIGTRSGGTEELIKDGFNGLLYTVGDYKELAEKIKYLYEHRDIAEAIGKNAQKWALERFSEDLYAEEVLATLQKVVANK